MIDRATPTALSPEARPNRRAGWALEAFDGGFVVYDPRTEQVVEFNQTAAMIWQLCDGTRSVAEITELLADSFPDDRERVIVDVAAAMTQLVSVGIVAE